ncbi:MAG: hypothetical protein JXA74_11750 [Anaerolineae bacterium]|nr:hypothetical protein [Anaerolineae bacterium]
MPRPVELDVIAPTLQSLGVCAACELVLSQADLDSGPHGRAADEYPAEWLAEQQRLMEWVTDLAEGYGEALRIRVIDPRSPEGLLKSLRHRVRRYPTWIVNGAARIVGWDRAALEAALAQG